MNRRLLLIPLVLALLFVAACRQQPDVAEPVEATPTLEVVIGGPTEEEAATAAPPAEPTAPPVEPTAPPAEPTAAPEEAAPAGAPPDVIVESVPVTADPLPGSSFVEGVGGAEMVAAAAGPIPPGSTVIHTVQPGDWLIQIARCYGAHYEAVRNANRLWNPDWLYLYQTVTVPNVGSAGPIIGPPCVLAYTVQAGDTWESLAASFGTTVAILQRANPGPLTVGRGILIPATGTGTGGQLPPRTHRLIFNYKGDVAVWQTDGRLEFFPDAGAGVLDVVTNDTGRFVLTKQSRDNGRTMDIVLVDLVGRTQTRLEGGLPVDVSAGPGESMLVSPDNRWGVYLLREGASGRVTIVDLAAPGNRKTLINLPGGALNLYTPELFPADANHFLWIDSIGVREIEYQLLTAPRTVYTYDPNVPQTPALLFARGWAPGGRYLLAEGAWPVEGGASFVLDVTTGGIIYLPGSDGYVTAGSATWRADGTITVLSVPEAGKSGPKATMYAVQPAGNALTLTRLTDMELTSPVTLPNGGEPGYVVSTPPNQPTPGDLLMSITQQQDGLWVVRGNSNAMTRLNGVLAGYNYLDWVPDGSGVLYTLDDFNTAGTTDGAAYAAAAGGPLFSLTNWLGTDIGSFNWARP